MGSGLGMTPAVEVTPALTLIATLALRPTVEMTSVFFSGDKEKTKTSDEIEFLLTRDPLFFDENGSPCGNKPEVVGG